MAVIPKDLYAACVKRWGQSSRQNKVEEELLELLLELTRIPQGRTKTEDLIDELGDAIIMLEQLEYEKLPHSGLSKIYAIAVMVHIDPTLEPRAATSKDVRLLAESLKLTKQVEKRYWYKLSRVRDRLQAALKETEVKDAQRE